MLRFTKHFHQTLPIRAGRDKPIVCGIVGIIRFDDRPVDRDALQRMNDTLVHRGPDDEGLFLDGSVGIAARRLSVIDVAGGHQPVTCKGRGITAAQNGEIYNFRSLRSELERDHGAAFKSNSDTEVILEGYAAWGEACVDRFNGMFAFAVYDREKRSVLLARDRSGIKPLFYYKSETFLAFASEIKAILSLPEVARRPDMQALDAFLKYKYIPGNLTFFNGIRKVLPARMMTVGLDGSATERAYWSLKAEQFNAVQDADTAGRGLRNALFESVERQMVSDVPLGAFLSGGIDSTIISGIMAQVAPGRVKTFCMGFKEQSFNEIPFARQAADFHKTEHHEFICEAGNLLELVPMLVGHFDEPLGDASMIPTYMVAKETRKHVTVALAGTGADELFAGYDRHRIGAYLARFSRLPKAVRQGLLPSLARLIPVSGQKKGFVQRLQRFLRVSNLSEGAAYENLTALFQMDDRRSLFCDDTRAELASYHVNNVEQEMEALKGEGLDFIQRAMLADLATILPNDYLTKDDRMSMACSLEVRVPFLDHELIEWAAGIPSSLKLKNGTSKAILREVFSDLLPPEIQKRGKYGFEAPIALWMTGERLNEIREILTGPKVKNRGILDTGCIQGIIDRHASKKENCMNQIFSLLTMEYWFQTYLD
jgi:asparagine synthase (glutamine-hydrolysing)